MPTITPFTYSGGAPGTTYFINTTGFPATGAVSILSVFTLHPSPAYVLIKHLHFTNVTAAPALFSVYANVPESTSVPYGALWKSRELKAYATYDWYSPGLKLLSTGAGNGHLTAHANVPDAVAFFIIGDLVTP